MKAYLIDPFKKKIEQVIFNGDYKSIYKFVECRAFDVVRVYTNEDVIYVDDEGLFVETQNFFIHRNYPTPLAGKGLVLGSNEEGDSVAPKTKIDQLEKDIAWVGDKHDIQTIHMFRPGIEDYRTFYFE